MIWEATEITPVPPIANAGNVKPSSPLYSENHSGVFSIICAIASKFPLASLIATIFGISARRTTVSTDILTTLRPGIL